MKWFITELSKKNSSFEPPQKKKKKKKEQKHGRSVNLKVFSALHEQNHGRCEKLEVFWALLKMCPKSGSKQKNTYDERKFYQLLFLHLNECFVFGARNL